MKPNREESRGIAKCLSFAITWPTGSTALGVPRPLSQGEPDHRTTVSVRPAMLGDALADKPTSEPFSVQTRQL